VLFREAELNPALRGARIFMPSLNLPACLLDSSLRPTDSATQSLGHLYVIFMSIPFYSPEAGTN
jgi:hypothetical protein